MDNTDPNWPNFFDTSFGTRQMSMPEDKVMAMLRQHEKYRAVLKLWLEYADEAGDGCEVVPLPELIRRTKEVLND